MNKEIKEISYTGLLATPGRRGITVDSRLSVTVQQSLRDQWSEAHKRLGPHSGLQVGK